MQLMAPPYTEVDSKSGLIDSLRNMMMGQLELGRDRLACHERNRSITDAHSGDLGDMSV